MDISGCKSYCPTKTELLCLKRFKLGFKTELVVSRTLLLPFFPSTFRSLICHKRSTLIMNKYISECDKTFIGRPGYTIETWSSEKLNQQRSKDVAPSTEAAHLLTHTPPVTTCLLAFTGSCSIKQADQEPFLQIRNTYL